MYYIKSSLLLQLLLGGCLRLWCMRTSIGVVKPSATSSTLESFSTALLRRFTFSIDCLCQSVQNNSSCTAFNNQSSRSASKKSIFLELQRCLKALEVGDNRNALVLRGWRLSSKTWNRVTSPWMKQSSWLRIVHSVNWCLMFGATHS